ncbi:MAG: carboxypeptidase-like regulatory domain-containing protein, partial [Gemmatimonadota bacterium]|nr:carboxypeptidase-like regulatory domain-containing protein [Gemmatimonadota bacterium]
MSVTKILCVILAIVVSCLVFPVEAQTVTVSGKVLNEAGEPLPAVTVILPELELGAFSDEEGRFRLENVPVGRHTIEFRFVGYRTIRSEVIVSESEPKALEVSMQPEALLGEEVTVTGER